MSRAQEHGSQVQGATTAADREALERLGATVADVCAWFRAHENVEFAVNTVWTARDALVHVLFWHESFARNVGDLAAASRPGRSKAPTRSWASEPPKNLRGVR